MSNFGDSLGCGEVLEFCNNTHWKGPYNFSVSNPKTIIELGANNGSSTREILSRMNGNDRMIAVEADPRCVGKINNHIHDSRLKLIHAAVTDKDVEEIEFHLCTAEYPGYGPWDCASSLKPIKHGLVVNPWLKYEQDVKVRGISLDTLYKENNVSLCDFVWCDVEGAYAEVVRGGTEAFKKTRFFYTECEDVETYEGEIMYPALKEMMEGIGWELVNRFRYDALFRNKELT